MSISKSTDFHRDLARKNGSMFKGYIHSEETRRKRSESMKAWHAQRKLLNSQ
ncbi:MAG: hypothetical protein HOH03_10415 [Candidatus Marinimicrobia bacterium]|nr:hypothetical protein [Candidatus Neomarinimicrobiota bacterium]